MKKEKFDSTAILEPEIIIVDSIEVRKDELYILEKMEKTQKVLKFIERGIDVLRTQLVPQNPAEMWWERRRFIRYSKFLPKYQAKGFRQLFA